MFITVCGFSVLLHLFFVKNTCIMGYGFGFWWSFRIVPFGFRFLFDPSGHYVLYWSRIAAKPLCAPLVNTVTDRLGFRTGLWTFIGFDCFACGFRFWSNFLFAVVRLWMVFATPLRFLMDPLILPHSGVPHGFLLCKLKISLSKITDLPFRSVLCLKLE